MTEYGYDIANMKAFHGEIEIPIEKVPRETLEEILGGIPIVRCKDCKWWNGLHQKCGFLMIIRPDAEDYCCWAERKEK